MNQSTQSTQASVARGATLSGFGTVDPTIATIAAGGTLSPGAAGAIGSLTINGPLDLYGNLDIGIDGLNSFDFLNVLGTATFDTTSFFTFGLGGDSNQTVGDTFQFFDANSFLDFADAGSNFACSGLASGLTCSLNSAGDSLFLTLNGSGNPGGPGGVTAVPEPSSLACWAWGWRSLAARSCSTGGGARKPSKAPMASSWHVWSW